MTVDTRTATAEAPAPATRRALAPVAVRYLCDASYWCVVIGLIALNVWWYYRDSRVLPDPNVVEKWIRQKHYDEAIPVLRETLRRSPNDGAARLRLSRALGGKKDIRGSFEQLHAVPFWWPDKPMALFYEGDAAMLLHRARDAEAAWRALIAPDPQHVAPEDEFEKAVKALIELYAYEERWPEAHAVIWRVYDQAGPEYHAEALMMRMRTEIERIAPENAVIKLRQYVEADPGDTEARRALARVEQTLGHKAEADRHIQAALKAAPHDPRVWIDWLTILQKRGDREGLADAAAKAPMDEKAWQFGDTDRGQARVLKASSDSFLARLWSFRGIVAEQRGDLKAAADAFGRAYTLQPFVEEYAFRSGLVERRLGHDKIAQERIARSQALRARRAELADANQDVITALHGPKPGRPDLAASVKRLIAICETLGWTREAQAWGKLLSERS